MSQALYRKYRPKTLAQVAGQEHITKTLNNALKTNKISHAYLFTGPKGVGKTSVARILAHEVNGLDYKDDSAHIDIIEIDAASNRRIDEIRELREMVYMAPLEAKYKVYIIDEVHMLTKEAFNALLKTLEEPPAHVIFILATTDAHKLPDTIISRTQRYSFKPITESVMIKQLNEVAKKEGIKIDEEAIELIAQHGMGSLRDSLSLLDQSRGNNQTSVTKTDVGQLLGLPPDNHINSIVDMLLGGGDTKDLVKSLNSLYDNGYDEVIIAKSISTLIRQKYLDGEDIDKQWTLNLLAELLNTPTAHYPKLYLELALIKALPTGTVSKEPETKKADEAEAAEPKKVAEAKVAEKEMPVKIKLDDSSWPEVLSAIKNRHNTLYSIVRMAEPSFSGDTLTLTFDFDFHVKRLSEASNRKVLSEVIKDISGQNIVVVFEKKANTNVVQSKESINKVSSIFNGAELLES